MTKPKMPFVWRDVEAESGAFAQLSELKERQSALVPYGEQSEFAEEAARHLGLDWEDTDVGLWIGAHRTYLPQVADRIARICTDWQTTGALKVQVKFLRVFDAEPFLDGMVRQRILETETRYHRNKPYRVWRKRKWTDMTKRV